MYKRQALGIVSSTLFQAVGRGVYSLIVSLMRQLVVLVPAAWVLARITGEVNAVWWAFPIAEVFSLIASIFLFRRLPLRDCWRAIFSTALSLSWP